MFFLCNNENSGEEIASRNLNKHSIDLLYLRCIFTSSIIQNINPYFNSLLWKNIKITFTLKNYYDCAPKFPEIKS